jgi:hypothetical protein
MIDRLHQHLVIMEKAAILDIDSYRSDDEGIGGEGSERFLRMLASSLRIVLKNSLVFSLSRLL